MAGARVTISAGPAVMAAIEAHAQAAGLDVSAYLVAAAVAQMAADDAATAVFASIDAEIASGMRAGAPVSSPPLPALADLSPAEQLRVRRVLNSALGTGETGPSGGT